MKIIPLRRFGKDHWSLLLYIESRCVDGNGKLESRCLRDRSRPGWVGSYATIAKSGQKISGHDDWNCIIDLEAAGLIRAIESLDSAAAFQITPEGWKLVSRLRQNRAAGKLDANFRLEDI